MNKEFKCPVVTSFVSEIISHKFDEGKIIHEPGVREIIYGYHPHMGHGSFGKEFENEYFLLVPISKEEINK